MTYDPLASLDGQPTPHVARPERGDPRYGWIIALLPLTHVLVQEIAILVSGHASTYALIVTLVVLVAVSVLLARRDERALWGLGHPATASPWLALLPGLYLLVRSFHSATYAPRAWAPFGVHLALSSVLFLVAQWSGGFLTLLEMQSLDYSG